MFEQYKAQIERLIQAAIHHPGATSSTLRQRIVARGKAQITSHIGSVEPLPQEIAEFVDKVVLSSHDIRDEDIAVLKAAGHSEDAILEITNCAALAAGIGRLDVVVSACER